MTKKSRSKSKRLTQEQNRKLNIRRNEVKQKIDEAKLIEKKIIDHELILWKKNSKSVGIFSNQYFTCNRDAIVVKNPSAKKFKNTDIGSFPNYWGPNVIKTPINRHNLCEAISHFYKQVRVGYDMDFDECEDLATDMKFQFFLQCVCNPPTKNGKKNNWIIGKDHGSIWMDTILYLENFGCRKLIISYFPFDVFINQSKDKSIFNHSIIFMDYYGQFKPKVDLPNLTHVGNLKNITDDYILSLIKPNYERDIGETITDEEFMDTVKGSQEAIIKVIDVCINNIWNNNCTKIDINELPKKPNTVFIGKTGLVRKNKQDEKDMNDDSDEDYDTCDEYEELIVD